MHIFLTGEIQIGKSTVIKNTLKLLNMSYGGFKTYYCCDRNLPNKELYMNSYSEPYVCAEENIVVRFKEGKTPLVDVCKFDLYGSQLIKTAMDSTDLIIMDECGFLERSAKEFQKQVIYALNGLKPVMGVVRLSSTGWTDAIRNHPNVKLIEVSLKNRNYLPEIIADCFK